MSHAASSKPGTDLGNSGLSNIEEAHNIINPVNNTEASKTLFFFLLCRILQSYYMATTKAVHCPATLGPTAVVHVTHPGCICILQDTEHPPHTEVML